MSALRAYMPAAFVAGVVLGALGAVTVVSGLRLGVTAHAYCTRCATHRHGGTFRDTLREGAVHTLLAPSAGRHAHAWASAASGRDAESRAMAREALRDEADELDALERDPRALGLMAEASRDNPALAAGLLRAVLDPDAHVPVDALRLVDRPSLAWPDRWRVVDGFLRSYRCERASAAVTCSLPVGGITVVAWHRVPGSLHRGNVPWATWVPAGFTPAAPPAPSLPPGAPSMTPIPPPAPRPPPDAPPPEAPPPVDEAPAAVPPAARDAAVERALQDARQGRLEAALAAWSRLRRVTPPPARMELLRATLRANVGAAVDNHILSGRCSAAQSLARTARGQGLAVDLRDHFGSACPQP